MESSEIARRRQAYHWLVDWHVLSRLAFVFVTQFVNFHIIFTWDYIILDSRLVKQTALTLWVFNLLIRRTSLKLVVTLKVLYLNFAVGIVLLALVRFGWRAKYLINCRLLIVKNAHSNHLISWKLASFFYFFKSVDQLHFLAIGLLTDLTPRHLQLVLLILNLFTFHHIVIYFLLHFCLLIILSPLNSNKIFHIFFSFEQVHLPLQSLIPFFVSMCFGYELLLLCSDLLQLVDPQLLILGLQFLNIFQLYLFLLMMLLL